MGKLIYSMLMSLDGYDPIQTSPPKPMSDALSLELIRKKGKEASQVFSPPRYSPFGESD
jgi:hypothetical protein